MDTKQFYNYLKRFKIYNSSNKKITQQITHTCCGPPYGKYSISDEALPYFYVLYAQALKNNIPTHITEMRTKLSPLIIDIDYVQKVDTCRSYTEDNIKKVIELYNLYILKYVNVSLENLQAFVFEKKEPTIRKNGKIKDGVHIIYPYICIKSELGYTIRDLVVKEIKDNNYFENIPHTNSLEEIFDKSVIGKTPSLEGMVA